MEEVTDREFCDIVKQNLSEKVKYKMISEKIFELIHRNGVTQKEFSEETGISQSTISDWKRKGTNPSADKILKICEVLKVTPYELLGENEIERKAVDLEMCAANTEEKRYFPRYRLPHGGRICKRRVTERCHYDPHRRRAWNFRYAAAR